MPLSPRFLLGAGCVLSLVACLPGRAQDGTAAHLSPAEAALTQSIDAHADADLALLRELVDINSGTIHPDGVEAVKDVLQPRFVALGFKTRWVPMRTATDRAGDLIAAHDCPAGEGKCGKRLLLIGPMDTVFEPSSRFQKYALVPDSKGAVATGPGVADMKGGLVVMLAALRALEEAGALEHTQIRVVLSGDEERVGDPVSHGATGSSRRRAAE